MINYIVDNGQIVAFTGILTAFFLTCICMGSFSKYLPKDMGRQYAHDGKLSAGKPRGAGFIFVLVFIASGIVFGPFTRENIIYIILLAAAMMTGFLDAICLFFLLIACSFNITFFIVSSSSVLTLYNFVLSSSK